MPKLPYRDRYWLGDQSIGHRPAGYDGDGDAELRTASSIPTSDLGQILRGHRFLHLPAYGLGLAYNSEPNHQVHSARAILKQDRLVETNVGVHVVNTGGDPLIALALLGKLPPENLLRSGEDWAKVLATGKGFGGRFVIDMCTDAQHLAKHRPEEIAGP